MRKHTKSNKSKRVANFFSVGTNDQSREEFVGQAVEIVAVERGVGASAKVGFCQRSARELARERRTKAATYHIG